MKRPLDFAAFPAVLLVTTLLRLSLNVASTRVVLLDGHTGTGAAGADRSDVRRAPTSAMRSAPFVTTTKLMTTRRSAKRPMAGFTVVDCSTVVATHLSHLMQLHAAKLLGRVETQQVVEHMRVGAPTDRRRDPEDDRHCHRAEDAAAAAGRRRAPLIHRQVLGHAPSPTPGVARRLRARARIVQRPRPGASST